MKWPTIKEVASDLRNINANIEDVDHDPEYDYIDVRLQVYPDGAWALRVGDPCYDQDHHGYWGAGSLPGIYRGKVRRFDSRDLARDLLDQCKDHEAECNA